MTDILERTIKENKIDVCINCGPEAMVRAVIEIQKKYFAPNKIYSLIEHMTECGIGLCGKCANSKGHRSCVDGPALTQDQI